MTDYYTQFNATIENVSPEAYAWLTGIFMAAHLIDEFQPGTYEELAELATDNPMISEMLKAATKEEFEELIEVIDGCSVGIVFKYDDDKRCVELIADKMGHIELAIYIMRQFLNREESDAALFIEWAHTTNKSFGFGGGWAVVTRHWTKYSGDPTELIEAYESLKKKKGKFKDLKAVETKASKGSSEE